MILDAIEFKKHLVLRRRYEVQYKKYERMAQDIADEMSCIPSLFPEMAMVKGKLVPVPKAHGDPKLKELRMLDMIDTKAKYENVAAAYKFKMCEVDNTLQLMPEPLKTSLTRIYVKGQKIEKVAKEKGYSASGYRYILDRELEKTFEELNFARCEKNKQ